jgi:hypothetical protein
VLDYVLSISSTDDTIYLAPANMCGDQKSEHELAYEYITERRDLNVCYPDVTYEKYIDTYGNAKYLKDFLVEKISHMTFDLVCAYIHSYRAEYCFKKEGFSLRHIHRVYYSVYNEKIVSRWWYYRYKPIHYVYELLVFLRDLLRR